VGADLPLETEKTLRVLPVWLLLDAVETDFGFDIEIYKNIKAGSGIGSSAASAAGAVYGINALLGTLLKPKIWYSLPCKAKTGLWRPC
jgi:homoserine kinase